MKEEINSAVAFIVRLIGKTEHLPQETIREFQSKLNQTLTERFSNHWFPEKPTKGQGYRCIRVNENDRRDPSLELACQAIGIKYEDLKLPIEMTLWVDPEEVTCRFGEHKGSYCVVAKCKDGNHESYIDQINIEELEQKSLERAKQASFDLVNSRKKKGKNGYQKNGYSNGCAPNGLYSGVDYANGLIVATSNYNYYGSSPKYGPMYGSSPPHHSVHNTPNHHNQNIFTPSYQISPPSSRVGGVGTPYRGGFGTPNGASPGPGSTSSYPGKFSRGLHSAFNNAALAFGSYNQQSNDRFHWMNKSIVKA